jgi:hypothetical protein
MYTFFQKITFYRMQQTDKNDYLQEKKMIMTVNDQQRLELYCHLV